MANQETLTPRENDLLMTIILQHFSEVPDGWSASQIMNAIYEDKELDNLTRVFAFEDWSNEYMFEHLRDMFNALNVREVERNVKIVERETGLILPKIDFLTNNEFSQTGF